MATVKGFRGMRYRSGDLNTLVCPPYDIISDRQREEFIEKNPCNVIRLELPKGGDDRYKEAGRLLNEWMEKDVLSKDEKNGIYIYEMEFTANGIRNKVKGFVSHVKLEEFSKGIVLPHEETLSKAKADRFNLMSETFCNFSQIYSLYMDDDHSIYNKIDSCSKGTPDMEVTDGDGTIHRMWIVTDEEVLAFIEKAFEEKKLYIADGHHRYETALNFHKHLCEQGISNEDSLSGYISMMLVNMEHPGLVVFPTHRIVRGLEGFDSEKVLKESEAYFDLIPDVAVAHAGAELEKLYGESKHAFALYTGGEDCTIMVLKDLEAVKKLLPDMSDAYCQLDVSVLHSLVLERIFGIDKENMANQKNLTYTRDIEEALEAVKDKAADCCFLLNPTRVQEIRDVALAGEKMPQKSTYFYPKLITGLVMNNFR